MRIFDKNKIQEIKEFDLSKGYLKEDKLFIVHHDAVEARVEVGHYETVCEYPSGGKDVKWVVDEPEIKAKDAHDEYEDIQVYIPYSESELAEREILVLKGKLASTDYKAIKFAEGVLTVEEYELARAERQAWRERIGELERILRREIKNEL